ncbi:hypothetical protein [Glycomyces sp. NPDC047010]|uniref:hypothetical protein n=1 Tax=Glycomyces sp. NPDC047010 TaxID=3155023 RepID=UPI0033E9073C
MTTPDPLETVFIDYTDDTAAQVRGAGTDSLWRKARRRRIGRTAAAGAAALALLAPAGWLLANTAGADDRSAAPPAAEQTTDDGTPFPDEDPNTIWEGDVLPAPEEIIGAAITLPSFGSGSDCQTEDAVIADGTFAPPAEDGAVYLKQLTPATLTGVPGTAEAVGLFGCATGGDTALQAVVLTETELDSKTWEATLQLTRSEPGRSPQLLSYDGDGLIVGYAEQYPAGDDVPYWFELIRLDDAGAPAAEHLGDLGTAGYADLDVTIGAQPAGEDGEYRLTVSVRNDGPRTAIGYNVSVCGMAPADVATDLGTSDCLEGDGAGVPVPIGDLAVGETFSHEWTTVVDVAQWQDAVDTATDDSLTGPVFTATVDTGTADSDLPPNIKAAFGARVADLELAP